MDGTPGPSRPCIYNQVSTCNCEFTNMDGGEVMPGENRRGPRAVFMAFGTKGDILPLAAIAAALSKNQQHYCITFITHSAHEYLRMHLAAANVHFFPISTPTVLPLQDNNDEAGAFKCPDTATLVSEKTCVQRLSPQFNKRVLEHQHRKECLTTVEEILGKSPEVQGDFIVINFFALEGWHLAELFQVPCIVAAPYVVPYSAPSSFERRFKLAHPSLYKQLQEASPNKVCWRDVMHWMWALFSERWTSWRTNCLYLSSCPLTDPITSLPKTHDWPRAPLLLYGFSKEVVECPDYWPASVRVCGFWFPPMEWEFSTGSCNEKSDDDSVAQTKVGNFKSCSTCYSVPDCLNHFLGEISKTSCGPIFIGLSSMGSMGFIKNPEGLLLVLKQVLEATSYRAILFSSGHPPLDAAIQAFYQQFWHSDNVLDTSFNDHHGNPDLRKDGMLLFNNKLFCYSGSIPYGWLFPKCSVAIHHGGSGTTAAALRAGIPQIICPFMLDQYYWAERMCWIGVAPHPLKKKHLIPDDNTDSIGEAASFLLGMIHAALNGEMKSRAAELAEKISSEDGVGNAVNVLKNEVCISASSSILEKC